MPGFSRWRHAIVTKFVASIASPAASLARSHNIRVASGKHYYKAKSTAAHRARRRFSFAGTRSFSFEPALIAVFAGTSGRARSGLRHHGADGVRQLDREREHDGRAALAGDVEQRAEIAQLHRLRHLGEDAGGLDQLLRRLLLALGIDDLGAPLAFGLGLAGDGADHALVEVDALDLDVGDLDAPGFGLLVEHVLDASIELVALG